MKSAVLKTKLKMQKHITKFLILTIILTAALSVNYLFAAWVGPTQAPPGGNTSTPIHVGSTNQVKDGGLSVNALSVFGGGYFQGNVDIDGGIEVGNTTTETAGTIRWTGADLEVYDGSAWVSLTSEEAAPAADPNYTDCINLGGSWIDAEEICYLSGSSCSSGWTVKENYSSTNSGFCNGFYQVRIGSSLGDSCGTACSTGSHYRSNSPIETCAYEQGSKTNSAKYYWRCARRSVNCSATPYETGCTKD